MQKKLMAVLLGLLSMVMLACSSSSEEPATMKINSVTPSGSIEAAGGEVTINILASAQPKHAVDSPWLKFSKSEEKTGNYVFRFNAEANTGAARTATVVFTLGSLTVKAEISQEAYKEPDPEPQPDPEPDPQPVSGFPLNGLGWNLGNQFDSYNNNVASETCWGNPAVKPELFSALVEAGVKTVRIPVTWLGKVGAAPEYKIDAAWMARVKEVVGYAEKAGLAVIINIHHDGAESAHWLDVKTAATNATVNQQIKDQLKAMWTQIAKEFTDAGDFLVFEPFNEIHDGGWGWGANRNDGGKQYKCVNEWNQVFVDAVRATGGKNATRWLAAVGYCTNPDLTMEQLALPADPAGHIAVAVHFYDPTEFTLTAKYDQWGHTGAAGKKETWGDEDNVRNIFNKLKTKYINRGIPVYIGEGGCVHRASATGEAFRKYYLEYVAKAAHDYSISSFVVWDNGNKGAGNECHGYFQHDNGKYINNAAEMIEVMVRAYTDTSAEYTLQSVYDRAPK